MLNILLQQLVPPELSTYVATVSGCSGQPLELCGRLMVALSPGRDRIRPWIGANWPKSGKFGPNMRVTMENPAKYSTEALTHECFSSHISTLLSTVSGTPINNQQQQLVELKSTFLVILTREPP